MPPKAPGQSILENAYKLATPGDNTAYYNAFAATYDSDFVAQMGYQYPKAWRARSPCLCSVAAFTEAYVLGLHNEMNGSLPTSAVI